MSASRCVQLLAGLSRLSRRTVTCRVPAGSTSARLATSLLQASTVSFYSTPPSGGSGSSSGSSSESGEGASRLSGFTGTTSTGSGLADQILSSQVAASKPDSATGESSSGKGGEKSEESKEDEEKEDQRRKEASWRAMKYSFAFFGVSMAFCGGWTIVVFGAPIQDPDGEVMPDEYSDMSLVPQYLCRTWRELKLYNKMIKDPSRDLLLPPPLQYPYMQPPYTLVLEMTGVLVHPDWTYKTGWRFKKRPGVDFFLQQVGPPLFEVVIYTAEQGFTASPIVDALDPQGYVMYRLFKDSTRYVDSHHVKDLNCLNRDLDKVIMVDWNEQSVQLNPRNQLKVKKWAGNDDDRSLVDLALLLKAVASSGVSDVREVMDHYRQYDDPLQAFRENQRLLQEQEEAMKRHRAEEEAKGALVKRSWTSSLLRR